MTYGMFYDLARYLNNVNNECFTPKEVACNAYEYMECYEEDCENNLIGKTMLSLLQELYPDKKFNDEMDKFDMTWNLVGAWNDFNEYQAEIVTPLTF